MVERALDLGTLQSPLDSTRGQVVACVGAVAPDRHVYGEGSRISPERPHPVLRMGRMVSVSGGVGNAAPKVAAMGGAGVAGGDIAGRGLADLAEIRGGERRLADFHDSYATTRMIEKMTGVAS